MSECFYLNDRAENMKPVWNMPPNRLLLSREIVHIWRAVLDLSERSIHQLKRSLSIDEMIKAERFNFEHHKNQYIIARGILRLILACYLSIEPVSIRFCYEKDGKPRLQNASGRTDIQFNLSHSDGLALYVFTRGNKAGIDLERIHDFPEMEQIVEQFFSAKERALFCALPASEKKKTFFNWWTRKEALMKATGIGLSYTSQQIDFLPTDKKSIESLEILRNVGDHTKWSIWDVRPAEEFAGAVVIEKGNWNVQYWQWSDENNDYLKANMD